MFAPGAPFDRPVPIRLGTPSYLRSIGYYKRSLRMSVEHVGVSQAGVEAHVTDSFFGDEDGISANHGLSSLSRNSQQLQYSWLKMTPFIQVLR